MIFPFLIVFGLWLWLLGRRHQKREQQQWQQFVDLQPASMVIVFGNPPGEELAVTDEALHDWIADE